mmetsp:Transcript_13587/g.31566  ORF Transcript_13587/g.31566 Transcript_13587/m.31566 type:complete len:154 (-) Transcript_13587:148-609(-)
MDMFTSSLVPWKHFIPVNADLSNLIEMVEFALAKENEDNTTKIIQEANAWCQENLIYSQLQDYFLTTLSKYILELDKGDPNWPNVWAAKRDRYLAGHFIVPRSESWSLPKSIVGAIKTGFRKDDPNYREPTGDIQHRRKKNRRARARARNNPK